MENLNLKEMTKEQLEKMMILVREELNTREVKKYIYKTDNYRDSRYSLQKNRCWAKVVTSVDTTKTNGYAFVGDFLKVDQENLVADNSLIVEHDGGGFRCYRLCKGEKEEVARGYKTALITFIQKVADALNNMEE